MKHFVYVFAALWLTNLLSTQEVQAQAGLRESLQRLDKNENGEIDPNEVTPLSRPYLERIAGARRMSLDQSNRIDKLQEAARIYYALKNGVSGATIRPEFDAKVKGFGTDRDMPIVPEFGLPDFKYPYLREDLDEADQTLRRYDRDKDQYIDLGEAAKAKWTHRDPFDDDLDNDNRLSRLELAQRYARRRLLSGASSELVQKAKRTGNGIASSNPQPVKKRETSESWRRGGTSTYLSSTILGRFDSNKNGRLELDEAAKLGIPLGRIDADRNGELSRDELHAFLTDMQDQVGDTSEVIPGWFYELDVNRDQQIVMTEFAEEWTDEKVAEFTSYDINGDGILTSSEVVRSKALVGGSYSNKNAEVLPPRKTVISEIEVTDDFVIGDLNVQISITHTHDSALDAYLTGPDGDRIELFTAVGGNDDHFDQTIFDDQSRYPITKARPPFKGTFLPEGLVNRQPGLAQFNGKSVKGVWQLIVRGSRSDRFGMLHSWSLMVTPQSDLVDGVAVGPVQDGPQSSVAQSSMRTSDQRTAAAIGLRSSDAQRRAEQEKSRAIFQWSEKMRERLASGEMDPKEAQSARKKLEQIEKYKQYMESRKYMEGGDKIRSEKENGDDRSKEKVKSLLKKLEK